MKSVAICEGLEWAVTGQPGMGSYTAFDEGLLEYFEGSPMGRLLQGDRRVHPGHLLGDRIGWGENGVAYSVEGEPDVVVKMQLGGDSFSHVAVNAALGEGFRVQHSKSYRTPSYLGFAHRGRYNLTFMERIQGEPLPVKNISTPEGMLNELSCRENIARAGCWALEEVGVKAKLATWDLHGRNIIPTHETGPEESFVILDQMCTRALDAMQWAASARVGVRAVSQQAFVRPLIRAEQAGALV